VNDKIMGGDLYRLWRVSDVHLPRVTDVFYDANRKINGAGVDGALSRYLADPANHDPNDPASNPPVAGSADDPGTPVLPAG